MKKYDVWTTQDGRQIKVIDLDDHHLLHIIRGIRENKVFTHHDLTRPFNPLLYTGDAWLTVLQAEALKRGLDWTAAPTQKRRLIQFLIERLDARFLPDSHSRNTLYAAAVEFLNHHGIPEPQIDVSNLDGKATYLHWAEGGTPLRTNSEAGSDWTGDPVMDCRGGY